jgi:Flp pilus assembly protein TadB
LDVSARRRPLRQRTALLEEVRAALAGGAAPGQALVAGVARDPDPGAELVAAAQAVRLGAPLADLAGTVTGDAVVDLLLRALAIAEHTGTGGALAVDQALAAAAEEADSARRLAARTAQARGTAHLLTALPVVAWLLFVVLDPALLRFYATAPGVACGLLALSLAIAGRWWAARLIAAGTRAAHRADPLAAPAGPRDPWRVAALAVPAFVVAAVALGPLEGLAAAAVLGGVGARRRRPAVAEPDLAQGGAAEAIELVAVALAAGLPPVVALRVVAPLAPPAARPALGDGALRLAAGEPADLALADGGLAALGSALAATERWGSAAAPALRRLAAEVRASRRAAAEEAAERTQLLLVFPTTLLTLPAFTVGVVPPMLWTAFAGAGG